MIIGSCNLPGDSEVMGRNADPQMRTEPRCCTGNGVDAVAIRAVVIVVIPPCNITSVGTSRRELL